MRLAGVALAVAAASTLLAQTPAPRKRLLVIGEEKGYRHEAITHAMVTIERLGKESGLWDTVIRTDTEALTKKKLEYNAKNLNDFDAVLLYTGGTLEMDDQQKADFLSFVHDDGKGFIGVHSATITWTKWPEYGELIGGYFDEHPWNTFDAPILVEDPAFPGMRQWPKAFTQTDEIYQMKNFSRENTRVLMRLDPAKLDLKNPKVHRADHDFARLESRISVKATSKMTKCQITPGSVDFEHRCYRHPYVRLDLKASLLRERGGLGGKRCTDPCVTITIVQTGNAQLV